MRTLPVAYQALSEWPNWILWRLDGDVKKPVSPHTGQVCNPHDPANRTRAFEALVAAELYGLQPGFVFTSEDPFFFVDLDHQLQSDGQWAPFVHEVAAWFPGALIERSQSGEGLHIIGQTQDAPPGHRCKRRDLGLEFYTTGRFVALTLDPAASGGANQTYPSAGFVERYLPGPEGLESPEIAWDSGPDPSATVIENDDELIGKMLGARVSAAGAFEGGSPSDLWNVNVEALASRYPSETGEAFDHSSADLALLAHLAFWTGKDPARMERIFGRSELGAREKWTEREGYRRDSIEKAIATCRNVYQKPEAAPVQQTDVAGMRAGYQYLTADQQLHHFRGCVYVVSLHSVFCPDGSMLSPPQFKATYGGYVFQLNPDGSKTTKNAFEAFTESQVVTFPKAHSVCFRPELPPFELVHEEGWSYANLYVPIEMEERPGDASPFLDLMRKQLATDHDFDVLLAYAAACVQYPGVKFQWCPVLQGVQGNGKTFIVSALMRVIGRRYSHKPSASDLGNKFNAWLMGKMFIGVEEFYADERTTEILKEWVTNTEIQVQPKGADQIMTDNRANFIMCTNHRDAVRKDADDRRYAVFYMAQQSLEDLERDGMLEDGYFPKLYAWLRDEGGPILAHYLKNYQIPDELNPATHCHRAPRTSSHEEVLVDSMGWVEREIYELIQEGRLGYRGGWLSSIHLSRDLRERGVKLSHEKRGRLIRSLGYVPHPALKGGRAGGVPICDNARPRLYCDRNNGILMNLTADQVLGAYERAQQPESNPAVALTEAK